MNVSKPAFALFHSFVEDQHTPAADLSAADLLGIAAAIEIEDRISGKPDPIYAEAATYARYLASVHA